MVEAYEVLLKTHPIEALREASMHFEKEGPVFRTLRKLTRRLDDANIPYAVAGGMALYLHGYQRFTDDVDVLVTREALAEIHRRLEGLGYVAPFVGSKNLRDAETGVRVEFLVAGGYPGDGKPKPVSFPDPVGVSESVDGVRCLRLATLVELKLASGTVPGRRKDLADVQELIRHLALTAEFANELDLSVRGTFLELKSELAAEPPQPE